MLSVFNSASDFQNTFQNSCILNEFHTLMRLEESLKRDVTESGFFEYTASKRTRLDLCLSRINERFNTYVEDEDSRKTEGLEPWGSI